MRRPARTASARAHPFRQAKAWVTPVYKHGAGTHTAANAGTGSAHAVVHVVVAGDSLSSLAQLYHRPRTAIAKANHIAPKTKIRIGQRLIIPSARASVAGVSPKQSRPVAQGGHRASKLKASAKPPVPQVGPGRQVATNDPPASAADTTTPTEPTIKSEGEPASDEPTADTPSFRWPVRGRIIAGFGPRPNGPHNDGINVAVPEGTSVKAAEDGVVVYAGNELKSYGNMVLVRHYNGYVTAYAHASEVMVKYGDQVKRGQIIAHTGQTGSVSAPQLHFEVRKGKVPLDPTQFLPLI